MTLRAGGNAAMQSGNALSLKAGTTAALEIGTELLVKAGNTATVHRGGPMFLKGAMMQLNNGARPAMAFAPMFVMCPENGGVATVQLPPQSPTLLIP